MTRRFKGYVIPIPVPFNLLLTIYKPVLDILSEMIALDDGLSHVALLGRRAPSDDGLPTVGLD